MLSTSSTSHMDGLRSRTTTLTLVGSVKAMDSRREKNVQPVPEINDDTGWLSTKALDVSLRSRILILLDRTKLRQSPR
jgi:hypothetical protein